MAKTKISEWSSTPANNTDIDSINIAEGCAPSGINDAIRELMAQVKDLYSGTSGDAIGVAGGGTGQTSYTNGQLLIGNTTGNTLTKATLTAGTGISVTNSTGSITIANTAPASSATPTVEGTVYGKMTSGGGTPFLTALGYNAAPAMTTGTRTVAVGREALLLNTSGDRNHAFGMGALGSNLTGSFNTAVGYTALNASTSDNNTAVGYQAGLSTTGTTNSFFGDRAGQNLTTGTNNTGIGAYTINGASGSGTYNVAVGQGAMNGNTSGSFNVSLGSQALQANTSASQGTAAGYQALYSNTTGAKNTAIGLQALYSNTVNGESTAVGNSAGYAATGGSSVFVGLNAGSNLTTGYYCTYVGTAVQANAVGVTNEIVIGTNAQSGKGTSTGFIAPGTGGVYQGNNSSSWSVTSDQRLKKNIVDNNIGLTAINSIQVRNFEYRLPEEVDAELKPTDAILKTGVQLGVIAQELQAVLPECVKQESSGVLSVDTDNLTWYLINAVKQLKAEIDELKGNV